MIRVKFKVFKIIFIVLIILLFILATFFLVKGLTMEEEPSNEDSVPSTPSVNLEEVISEIKSENTELVYESTDIPEFTSLVFLNNEKYTSYIVDTYTGEELELKDIIKDGKIDDFETKEEELLRLKYPEFIVDGILNGKGEKVYLIYDNEMIVYYYGYTYEYDYQDVVFLKINYNEVHDYLDFTHLLDKEYTNEDGYQYSTNKKT